MSAKLTLVKGPALQKLFVLVLLTLTGLGYPPPLSEAVKCHSCKGQGHVKDGKDDCTLEEIECDVGCAVHRHVTGGSGRLQKGCHDGKGDHVLKTQAEFECMQTKLEQLGGNCVKATMLDYSKASGACQVPRSGDDKAGAQKRAKWEEGGNNEEYCKCDLDLCNNEDLRDKTFGPGGNNGGSGGGGKARAASVVVATPRMIILIGIINGMITLLAT